MTRESLFGICLRVQDGRWCFFEDMDIYIPAIISQEALMNVICIGVAPWGERLIGDHFFEPGWSA